jgi:hypothetical protein
MGHGIALALANLGTVGSSGPPAITGTIAQRIGRLRQSATGALTFSGTAAQRVGGLRQAAAGTVFDPSFVPGLVLWLRGDLGITLNAGNVSAWADQSGSGHDATQPTAIQQPATSTSIGGQACVSFNGSTGMRLPNFGALGAKTVFYVRKFNVTPSGRNTAIALNDGVNRTYVEYSTASTHLLFAADFGAAVTCLGVTETLNTVSHADWIDYNGGTNTLAPSYANYFDGAATTVATTAASIADLVTDFASIGARITSAAALSQGINCDFAEILAFNANPSTANRNKVSGYIQTRYGITMAGATF